MEAAGQAGLLGIGSREAKTAPAAGPGAGAAGRDAVRLADSRRGPDRGVSVVAVALDHTRAAVSDKTGRTFALTRLAATAAQPTDFTGRDPLTEAARTAAMIRALAAGGVTLVLALGVLGALGPIDRPGAPARPRLSPREAQILRAIVSGLSYREIALRAGISYKTVANVSQTLKDKPGATSLADLIARGVRHMGDPLDDTPGAGG